MAVTIAPQFNLLYVVEQEVGNGLIFEQNGEFIELAQKVVEAMVFGFQFGGKPHVRDRIKLHSSIVVIAVANDADFVEIRGKIVTIQVNKEAQ